jgi:hypothetical protein
MSEYQYYEFQAIDRPLTEREMGELRSFSSRATITPTRFVNHYEWGSFKGNPSAWMEKYFDAFLYLANWGTHELMLRLPRRVLDASTVKQYCCGESASARAKSKQVILEFRSESESGEWIDEDTGHLALLVPLRADIASGDLRALYLAWLACVRRREAERAAQERARREQEAAEARERYLAALAQRKAEAWREVDALIATKQPGKYDDAVKLLKDLHDIPIRAGRQGEVEARLVRLREQHAKKPCFVACLQAAGLIGTTKEGRL